MNGLNIVPDASDFTGKQLDDLARMLRISKVKPAPLPISFYEIDKLRNQFEKDEQKNVFTLIYLTGQRVSEALDLRRDNIRMEVMPDGTKVLVLDSLNEKNRQNPRRVISIPMVGREADMIKETWESFDHFKPDRRIIPYTRVSVYLWFSKIKLNVQAIEPTTKRYIPYEFKLFPHYLRHCRASHLACDYDMSPFNMMKYFGWKSLNMVDLYASSNWRNLAKAFMSGIPLTQAAPEGVVNG